MISKIYVDEVRRNLKPYFGIWQPDQPIDVGEYGYYIDGQFKAIGNIKDRFNIDYKVVEKKGNSDIEFTSDKSIQINPTLRSEIAGAATNKIEISFKQDKGVYFCVCGCRYKMIENLDEVGNQILKNYVNDDHPNWDPEFYLITDIVYSKTTLVSISNNSNAHVVFDIITAGDFNNLTIKDTGLKLKVATQNSIGYCLRDEDGLSPLCRFAKIKKAGLFKRFPKFVPVFGKMLENKNGTIVVERSQSNAKRELITFDRI